MTDSSRPPFTAPSPTAPASPLLALRASAHQGSPSGGPLMQPRPSASALRGLRPGPDALHARQVLVRAELSSLMADGGFTIPDHRATGGDRAAVIARTPRPVGAAGGGPTGVSRRPGIATTSRRLPHWAAGWSPIADHTPPRRRSHSWRRHLDQAEDLGHRSGAPLLTTSRSCDLNVIDPDKDHFRDLPVAWRRQSARRLAASCSSRAVPSLPHVVHSVLPSSRAACPGFPHELFSIDPPCRGCRRVDGKPGTHPPCMHARHACHAHCKLHPCMHAHHACHTLTAS